ncbi:putative ammonium transporter 2 [Lineus longissimus]|uniref:putative ammonium transporter 2 n=1 Tax=Lineus longissimus TaxID=88925 RepID=UPI002B4C87C6
MESTVSDILNAATNFTDEFRNASLSELSNLTQNNVSSTAVSDRLITWDDATWILTSSFVIFTMQSGFGLLEAGVVSGKNEVNIMVKNAVDVIFGGLTFWMFGYALSFGEGPLTNAFCGVGHFFVDIEDDHEDMGYTYANYIFQLSFATTATTIVSGAMAERTKLSAYIVFSFFNTLVYCMPAHWVWGKYGFLKELGVLDIAGAGPVHLVGGVSALVAAIILKPRHGRYDNGGEAPPLGNPTNCLVGMFMLWWGWLGFNCGSTFGISGGKWKLAAKSAVTTVNASMAGGSMGLLYSYIANKRKFMIPDLVNSVLGALVAVTAPCALIRSWEALVIGAIGGLGSVAGAAVMDGLKIDDPVGAVAVHAVGGMVGLLAVGFFVDIDPLEDRTGGQKGLFHGGGWRLLGVQTLAVVSIAAWSAVISFTLLFIIDKTIGLRMSVEEEILGTDFVEHGIGQETDLLFVENPSNSPIHAENGDHDDRTVSVRRKSTGGFGFQRTYRIRERRGTKSGFACRNSVDMTRTRPQMLDHDLTCAPKTNGTGIHMNGGSQIGTTSPKSNRIYKTYEQKYDAEYTNAAFELREGDTEEPTNVEVKF